METINSSSSLPLPIKPATFDEISMNQSLIFSDSLKDLRNLRKQLYSAAEYFELSYTSEDQKHIVINSLKDYAIKALVNTVDHLGSVTFKINHILDKQVDQISQLHLQLSSTQQRFQTCQEYISSEGVSQQSLAIDTPKYHKRYILPVGETVEGATRTRSKLHGCNFDDEDDWHEVKNAVRATLIETPSTSMRKIRSESPSPRTLPRLRGTFSFTGPIGPTTPSNAPDKRTVSPHRFPILRTGSFRSKPTTPNSRQTTPISSRPTTPNSHKILSEPHKSASMRFHEVQRDGEQIPSKSKRLLKALLSRRKSKKDENLLTYLDEY